MDEPDKIKTDSLDEEIDDYLKARKNSGEKEALIFWKTHEDLFKGLAFLATNNLSIVC